jgi:type II secretory pathway component PulM
MMQSLRSAWQARWSQASAREQTLVRIAVSVLLLAISGFLVTGGIPGSRGPK